MKKEKSNCCNAPLKKYLYGTSKETGAIFKDKCAKCDNIYPFAEKFIEDHNHPYGGMEVLDNMPKETMLDRFMTEFTDPDTVMLDISKYDHERIINFFNNEIK